MKILIIACLTITIFLSASATAIAQPDASRLSRVTATIANSIQERMPEWKRNAVSPLEGSENVVIDQWVSDNQVVKVSIMQHNSAEEAVHVLRKFAEGVKADARLYLIGDEAYAWNIQGSIAFKKHNFTIYVSAVVVDLDDEKPDLNKTRVLSKEFAQHVAAALLAP